MFYSVISKESLDEIFSMFFRNLGLIDPQTDLILTQLEIDGDSVVVEAEVDQGTLQ